MNALLERAPAACAVLLLLIAGIPVLAAAQQPGTDVTGRVLDSGNGLPVPGATIDLMQGDKRVAETRSNPDGSFTFKSEPQGIYNLNISATGYSRARSGDLVLLSTVRSVQYQITLQRVTNESLRTIASVNVGGRSALQTSTTINASIDPSILQSQNYMRTGDALATVPGLNAYTSSAVGDDINIGIRGFNDSETASLLDGHPIGPIGAVGGTFGGGQGAFDYQDSPFWGLRNVQTIFGSGAAGIYGATTIAGAIDFQTIDPTRDPHGMATFGVGNNGKTMSAAQATGSVGKFGYAAAWGVEGTYGMFIPQVIPQTGLLGNNQTRANLTSTGITYSVSGGYTLRDGLLKLAYNFNPTTNVTLTGYTGSSWDDKSGNGDTDFNTYQLELYTQQQAIAGATGGVLPAITLANGSSFSCGSGLVPVQADTASGGACETPQQYAAISSGPAGGGPSPWQAIRNQDYHGRFSKTIGAHTITLDGYVDNYAVDYNRNVSGGFSTVCNCFTGFFRTNRWNTHGILAGDEFQTGKHDLSFGYFTLHQAHYFDQFGATAFDSAGNPTAYGITQEPTFYLDNNYYYVRDQYQPNSRLSLFGSFWFNHTNVSKSTNFDPRLTIMWRPDPWDVVRFTGGRANSNADPSLAFGAISYNTNYQAITTCPGGKLNVATGPNPNVQAETATDVEGSVGHRFGNGSTVQVEAYSAYEHNALLEGLVPFSALPGTPPPGFLGSIFARMQSVCGIANPTVDNLTASAVINAADARYRGLVFSGTANIVRNFSFNAAYNIQSASFLNVPDYILVNNALIVNGAQVFGTPLRTANMGFAYNNPRGISWTFDGHFIDTNNGWNRPAFWFANASVSNNFGPATVNLGINNIFNSNAQNYGLIGLGTYAPVNAFNQAANPNALAESSEEFGLPFRQIWLTVTYHY